MRKELVTAIGVALLTASPAAFSYVGPGLGLGILGVIAAFVMSIFLALVSIVWYPLKRMFKKKGTEKREGAQPEQPQESQ